MARREGSILGEAWRGDQRVALRLERDASGQGTAELEVLSHVEHPGLARLVDFGVRPKGGQFVAREWVDGVPLDALLSDRSPADLAAIVAALCPALDHLHQSGFVHADLKLANVLVRDGDRPVLSDFGLARARRTAPGAIAGTPLYIAPEVLAGEPPDAPADLFALGAMLVELLAPAERDLNAFYARFPAKPYLEALGLAPEALPEWSRDLVVRLVDLDPAARPASAAQVGEELRGRLGGAAIEPPPAPLAQWGALRGRAEAVALLWRTLPADARFWWRLPAGEDVEAVSRTVLLAALAAGRAARRLDLGAELHEVRTTKALDDWVRALQAFDGTWLIRGHEADPWRRAAFDALVQACGEEGRGRGLVVFSTAEAPSGWRPIELEGPREDEIHAYLRERFEDGADERLESLAARLHAECGGAARVLNDLLAAIQHEGWAQATPRGYRLRKGALPSTAGRARHGRVELEGLGEDERALLVALVAIDDWVEPRRLALHVGRPAIDVQAPLRALARAGRIELRRSSRGRRLVRASAAGLLRSALGRSAADWRAAHARWAEVFEAEGASFERALFARAASRGALDDASFAELATGIAELRDRGLAEYALSALRRIERELRAQGVARDPRLTGLEGLLWAVLREEEQALARAAQLDRRDPQQAGFELQIRGKLYEVGGVPERAVECYREAAACGAFVDEDLWNARAMAHFQASRDAELDELVAAFDREHPSGGSRRVEINLHALAAMAAFRRGDAQRARASLEHSLSIARATGDELRESAVRFNLGTIERRTGSPEAADRELERALELARSAGHLDSEAKCLAQLGAARRDQGRLAEAEALLLEAVRISARGHDRRALITRRGVLALTLVERGRLRAALTELERGAAELDEVGSRLHAALLSSFALEARARLGQLRASDLSDDELEGLLVAGEREPRVALALARAAQWLGARERARELIEKARAQATALGRRAELEEADLLDAWLAVDVEADAEAARAAAARAIAALGAREFQSAAARRELELLRAIGGPDWDEARATALATDLTTAGRDALAARLWVALAARAETDDARRRAREAIPPLVDACTAGLGEVEADRYRRTWLGLPDPWRDEWDLWGAGPDAETEMEILSLLEINQRLVEQQDLGSLLGTIVECALEVTGAERGFLLLREGDELWLDHAFDSVRGDIGGEEVELSSSIVREALDTNQVLRLSDASTDPELGQAASVMEFGLHSILCQPFDVQDGLRGAIYLDDRQKVGAFDNRAERLLGLLAGQAALAIRQVRRVEEIRALNAELGRKVAGAESRLEDAERALKEAGVAPTVDGLIGSSPAMRRVHELLHRVGPAEIAVLVHGATGTGKELAARALHQLSPRHDGPLVSENCAAIPESLIESELFGYCQGAFTGATRDTTGLFERAHGGTLFLDEVGELPLDMQAKLLRVLETRTVRRLGTEEVRPVDFRLVTATNRQLEHEVEEGRFRADLLFRLDGVRVEMPSLSQRTEDIPALVEHFLRIARESDGRERRVAPEVLQRLCEREWPGNVRELANEVQRLCVLSSEDIVDPDLVREPSRVRPPSIGGVRTLAELEREAILAAVEQTGGDKGKAAKLLGISRAKLYQRLKEWREEDEG